jgi:hypothetical protein
MKKGETRQGNTQGHRPPAQRTGRREAHPAARRADGEDENCRPRGWAGAAGERWAGNGRLGQRITADPGRGLLEVSQRRAVEGGLPLLAGCAAGWIYCWVQLLTHRRLGCRKAVPHCREGAWGRSPPAAGCALTRRRGWLYRPYKYKFVLASRTCIDAIVSGEKQR